MQSNFTFVENAIRNSPKAARVKFLESDSLSCFISIKNFGSFRNTFAANTSLFKFHSLADDLFCYCKRSKWFLWAMTAAQAAENHGHVWDFTWLRWGIYTSIPTWTHKLQYQQLKHKVYIYRSMEHLFNDHKDRFSQHENSHKLWDEEEHSVLRLKQSRWKLKQKHDGNFLKEGKSP